MKYVLALCSLLAVVWSGQALAANVYWAKTTGSNTPTCANIKSIGTMDAPGVQPLSFGSIKGATKCATVAGDVVNILPDASYTVSANHKLKFDVDTGLASGTSDSVRTVIQGDPSGAKPTIIIPSWFGILDEQPSSTRKYILMRHLTVDGTGGGNGDCEIGIEGDHITLEDMVLTNPGDQQICAFRKTGTNIIDHLTIRNVSMSGYAADGNGYCVYASANDVLIEYSECFHKKGGGFQIFDNNQGVRSDRAIIRYNWVHDIIVNTQVGITHNCFGLALDGNNDQVYHNVLTDAAGCAEGIQAGSDAQTGITVYGNTLYNFGATGIYYGYFENTTGNLIYNNHIIGGTAINHGGTATGTESGNRSTGSITDCTVSTSNFTQKAASSCINQGNSLSGFPFNLYTAKTKPDIGAYETFGFTSAVINDVVMDVTLGMNLEVPILPATGITGFTVGCSGGSNCGTPVVASAIKKAGSDSIVRLTISGMGGAGVSEVGQTWTVSYTPGNVTNSSGLGGALAAGGPVYQPMVAFTTKPVTNASTSVPPVTSTITLEGSAVQSQAGTGTTVALQCGTNDNRFVFVSVGVRDSTNYMSGITYNGVALTQAGSKVVNSSGGVTGQVFYLANAASGSNTLSMTMSASDNWSVVAECWSGVDTSVPIGTPVTSTSINAAGSITATATGVTDGLILDAVAKDSYTVACAEDVSQTEVVADGRSDGSNVRAQASYKAGVGSVVMTWTGCTAFGSETIIAVPVYPATTPTPPAVGTFTQAAHRISSAYTKGGIEQPLSVISAANTSVRAGVPFAITTQLDCTGADCDPVGLRLRYSRNGAPFVRVPDVMDSNQIAFIGNIASNQLLQGAVACCLSGALTPIAGTTQLTMDATPVVDLAQDASTVQRRVLVLGPDAVNGDTIDFEEYNQDLNPLDAYVPSGGARITVSTTQIAQVTGLHLVGPTAHSTLVGLVWSPSTDLFLQGYKVYRSTTSGVYGEAVHTITEATAGATMSPMTQWIHNEPVADTYYFVVTAFDWGGQESIVSSEVSVVKTGQGARRTR